MTKCTYQTMLRKEIPKPNLTTSIRQTTEKISRGQYYDAKFNNSTSIDTP